MIARNHPGRKNSRRITVAIRLRNAIKEEMAKKEPDSKKVDTLKEQLEKVEVKIVSPEVARASRTKKYRGPKSW